MNLKSCMVTEREGSAGELTGGWVSVTVPLDLLSHESTEHYTPQYLFDAVIACMGAIDLDPCSNSQEIMNVPAGIIPLMTTDLFCCESGGVGAVREIKYEKLIGIFPNISQMGLSLGIIWEFSQTTPKKMKG